MDRAMGRALRRQSNSTPPAAKPKLTLYCQSEED